MKEKTERKSNLVTVRLSEGDMDVVNSLSERTNRSVSDTILRACKFGLNVDDIFNEEHDNEKWGETCKKRQVHLRLTDSDKNMFDERGRELGKTVSQIVRASIRAYDRSLDGGF